MSEPITVKLTHPIQGPGGNLVEELVFRRPVAEDFDGLTLTIGDTGMVIDFTQMRKLAGKVCGQTDVVMRKLDIADMGEVGKLVMGFIEAGQETGEKA